jgi:hypothetical protein
MGALVEGALVSADLVAQKTAETLRRGKGLVLDYRDYL